jgi:hypothetical protein
LVSNSLNVTKELWDYTIRQCIGYPEIAYSICYLIAKRCLEGSIEKDNKVDIEKSTRIADLMVKYKF